MRLPKQCKNNILDHLWQKLLSSADGTTITGGEQSLVIWERLDRNTL